MFLKHLLLKKGIPEELVDEILSYIDDEVLLRPKPVIRASGLDNNMYQLIFLKLTEVSYPEDVYICECKQLPSYCYCKAN